MTFDDKLDKILDTPTRYIHQYGCACTKLKLPKECDCEPFDTLAEAKQAIKDLVLSDVVGENHPFDGESSAGGLKVRQRLIINGKESDNE